MAQGYLSSSLAWARACWHTRATGSLVAETQELWRFPLKWPLLVRPPSHKALMEIWLALAFFLTPHHFESWFSGHIWGWGSIPHKYQRPRRAKGHSGSGSWVRSSTIWTEAMDVARPLLLLLCVLHLTCKYCLLCSAAADMEHRSNLPLTWICSDAPCFSSVIWLSRVWSWEPGASSHSILPIIQERTI